MNYLFIINESPYGSETPYNALRLAMTLQKEHQATISIFFLGDSVVGASRHQQTPDGYYNIERMIKVLVKKQAAIYLCGTCLDARGMSPDRIIEGCKRSTMSELGRLTEEADKVLTF